jgi:DNA-binding transcriptional LysR family regulator
MEVHQIKYMLAIVREGNFSKAATACNVSQPSITRAIRKLEDELGGLLFERRPGHVELTQLGRTLLPRLETIYRDLLATIEEANRLNERRKQSLRLGLMCTLGPKRLIDLVRMINDRIPDLELIIEEGRAHEVIERLVADKVDVAIACLPSFPDEIAATRLYSERYAVAFATGHRLARLETVPFSELLAENYIERLNCEFDDYYASHFGDEPFDVTVKFSSEREDWVQAMIKAGFGIAIVPEHLPVAEGVETRVLSAPEMIRNASLLTVRGRRYTPAVEAFVRTATAMRWSIGDAAK